MGNEASRIQFSYEPSRDAWNIIHAAQSTNHPCLSEVEQLYVDRYGAEFKQAELEEFVVAYAREQGLDIPSLVVEREKGWRPIEGEFLRRMDSLFQVTMPELPAVYLTVDKRCSYSFKGNYFFVSAHGKWPNKTIGHELIHFYTWHAFGKSLVEQGLPPSAFNDLKESLTELMNVTCADLLAGARDDGYPQHSALRARLRAAFEKSEDVRQTVAELLPSLDSNGEYRLPDGEAATGH